MMWWAIWCTMMLASSSTGAAAPAPDALAPLDMLQLDPTANDDESLGYAVQPMSGHYDAGTPWLYLLADIPRDSQNDGAAPTHTKVIQEILPTHLGSLP